MKRILLALVLTAFLHGHVYAQVARYWDINGATAGAGGASPSGTWDAVTANWNAVAAGTGATAAWVSGNNARFSAGTAEAISAFTVTVSGTINVNQIGVEEGDPTFNGGILVFGIDADGVASNTSLLTGITGGEANVTITMNSQVSGTNGFRMARSSVAGTHILNLNNTANDWTNGLFINSGQLIRLGASGVIPDSNIVTFNTAAAASTLDLNNFNETVQSISQASGTASNITLGSGTLTVAMPAGEVYIGVISGTGSLVKENSGTLILTGANTYTGGTTITDGSLRVGNGGATGAISNTGVVQNDGNIEFRRSNTYTYSGTITGSGTVTKMASGTTILQGNNSYTGETLVNTGRLEVESATALGTTAGATIVAPGAELLFDGVGTNFTLAEPITIAGPGLDGGAITVQNSANVTFSGPITIDDPENPGLGADVTVSGTATAVYNNPNAFTSVGDRSLTLQGGSGAGGGGTISGIISLNAGSLTKNQTGTWLLSAATGNSYSGGTTINSGNLTVTNTSGSGTGSGTVTVAGGALNVGNGGAGGSVSGDIVNNATVNFNRSDASTYAGQMSGTGVVNKNGAGTLSLTNANTYTGTTTINAGTLQANNATGSATGTGAITVNSGGTLAGSGAVSGAVTVDSGGTLAPGTSIESLGTGALTFNATSTFAVELNTSVSPFVGADLVNANGNLSILTGALLSLVDLGNGSPSKFTLISYSGTWDNGIFLGRPDDTVVLVGANSYVINYNDTTGGANFGGGSFGNYLTLTTISAVPEASAFLFGSLVCVVLGLIQGRRTVRRRLAA